MKKILNLDFKFYVYKHSILRTYNPLSSEDLLYVIIDHLGKIRKRITLFMCKYFIMVNPQQK